MGDARAAEVVKPSVFNAGGSTNQSKLPVEIIDLTNIENTETLFRQSR